MTALTNNLQPLSMSQLLDRAIRLYRNNFLLFIGIVAVAQIPATAVNMIGLWLAPVPSVNLGTPVTVAQFLQQIMESSGVSSNPWIWLGQLVSILLVQLAAAAMTKTVAENYLGNKLSLWNAYRKIGRAGFTLLLSFLISILVVIVIVFWWVFGICIGWLTGLGMLLFFGTVMLPLLAPVIVLEQRGPFEAIRRTWDLARRDFLWLVGFMLLLGLFGQLIVTGPAALSIYILQSTIGSTLNANSLTLLQQVIGLLLTVIYQPLQLACVTLLYFNLRINTEGFDLALLALSENPNAENLSQTAPPLDMRPLPNWPELGYFALFQLAYIVLIAGIFVALLIIGLGLGGL